MRYSVPPYWLSTALSPSIYLLHLRVDLNSAASKPDDYYVQKRTLTSSCSSPLSWIYDPQILDADPTSPSQAAYQCGPSIQQLSVYHIASLSLRNHRRTINVLSPVWKLQVEAPHAHVSQYLTARIGQSHVFRCRSCQLT